MAIEDPEVVSRVNRLLLAWFPSDARARADNYDLVYLYAVDLSRYQWRVLSVFFDNDAESIRDGRPQVFALDKDQEAHAIRSEKVNRFGPGDD